MDPSLPAHSSVHSAGLRAHGAGEDSAGHEDLVITATAIVGRNDPFDWRGLSNVDRVVRGEIECGVTLNRYKIDTIYVQMTSFESMLQHRHIPP